MGGCYKLTAINLSKKEVYKRIFEYDELCRKIQQLEAENLACKQEMQKLLKQSNNT